MTPLFVLAFVIIIPIALLMYQNRKTRVKYPPGPMALPVIGHLHLIGPFRHRSFSKLAARYGPLMYLRAGSHPIVVVSSPEIAKAVFKNHDPVFSDRLHTFASTKFSYRGRATGFAPYGPYWVFIKKLTATELVSTKALSRTAGIRTRELHHLIGTLFEKSKARERVDLTKELLTMTSNNISMMMISKRCSATPSEADEVAALVSAVTQISVQMDMAEIFLGQPLKYSPFRKTVEDFFRRFDHLVDKIVTDRENIRKKDNDQEIKDYLDILLDLVDDDEADVLITREHVKALVLEFLVAATDTTAMAVEWAIVELVRHPEKMKRAQDEVDQVAGSQSRMVEELDNRHLTFITAIVKETFRLHPPLPLVPRKSTQECTINGFTIPAGAALFVNSWAIGRDPKVWDAPTEFRPERFLLNGGLDLVATTATTSVDVIGNHYQLLPFGSGRRRCPGANLAVQSITTTLAALVQCFDWEVAGDVSSIDLYQRLFLPPAPGQHLECFPVTRYTPKLDH